MEQMGKNELYKKFMEHKKWLDSLGEEGENLFLDEIDLRQVSIENEVYEQGYIAACIFNNREMKDFSFYLSKLYSSSFKNCKLENVDFTKGELSYTNFSDSILCNVNFHKCDCTEGDFHNSKLFNVKLTDVFFDAVDLRNVIMQDVDISYSSFMNVLVKGISLKNVVGFEKMTNLTIDVGEAGKSVILQGAEAIQWLNNVRD